MHRNGIDLDLLGALEQQLTTSPQLGAVAVDTDHRWAGTYAVDTSARQVLFAGQEIPRAHQVRADLLEALGGADSGPSPSELLLSALAACVTQRFVEQAALGEVEVDEVDVSCRGHLDLRGVFGDEDVRPGLTRIDIELDARTSAGPAAVEALLDAAVRTSPIADSLTHGTEIRPRAHVHRVGQHA